MEPCCWQLCGKSYYLISPMHSQSILDVLVLKATLQWQP
jgi:hypothetical protein